MSLLENWIAPFPFLTLNNPTKINCNICDISITCLKKGDLDKHFYTQNHIRNAQLHRTRENDAPDISFKDELCNVFVSANIPFKKLNNPHLKQFLEKHCRRTIPDESTVRRQLNTIYLEKIHFIQAQLKEKPVWVSVDETTDPLGRSVINVIVGALDTCPTKSYLLKTEITEGVNFDVITKIVDNALDIIMPASQKSEKVLLLVTDAAKYMVKAGRTLQEFLPNMIHITCLAHALHRMCEYVREKFENVNTLISCVKKIFLKSPSRINYYKQKCPNLKLPPRPVVTRWGTWIDACEFYYKNYDIIKNVILELENSATSVIQCKQLLQEDRNLKTALAYIVEYFGFIPNAIKSLETQQLSLPESITIFNDAIKKLDCVPDEFGVKQYIHNMLDRNTGFKKLNDIATAINSDTIFDKSILNYKFAPVTSCDVERSFSQYKDILSSKRHSFTIENLTKYAIVYCNKFSDI